MEAPFVLVVDDDYRDRFIAVELAGATGLAPIEAESAKEAREVLERRDDVRMVIVSVVLLNSFHI